MELFRNLSFEFNISNKLDRKFIFYNMKIVENHSQLTKLLLKSFTFLLFFSMSFSLHAQDAVDSERQLEGRKLFKSLCSACHKLDKKFVGPALGGVEEKRETNWLKSWIKDNNALRASGDADAINSPELIIHFTNHSFSLLSLIPFKPGPTTLLSPTL